MQSVFRLIIGLKEEERIMQDKLRVFELDPSTGINIRSRNPRYIMNDRRIKNMVTAFNQIQDPTNDQIENHIRAMQYRIADNNFDNWDN